MKIIKYISVVIILVLTTGSIGGTVFADRLPVNATIASSAVGDACAGLQQLSTTGCSANGDMPVTNVVAVVIKVLSLVVGIVSVIVIIFSGFRFVSSGGDTGAVSSAKNTLIYAIVGLVIAVLAQFIASHVLNSASNVSGFIENETRIVQIG